MEKIHYIREIMQRQGVTIAELARRLGVTQPSVSSYLVHDMRLSKAAKIADALGVSLQSLFVPPTTYIPPTDIPTATITCPKCGTTLEISVKQK